MSRADLLFDVQDAKIQGPYRYSLSREMRDYRPKSHTRSVLFVMLNPSTADALKNDPTIRRCMAFADRLKCWRLEVVNLFAWRATDPRELLNAEDPRGPVNDQCIREAVARSDLVVAAWGGKGHRHTDDWRRIVDVALERHGVVYRIGPAGKGGAPRHPLFLPADAGLEVFKGKERS